MERKAHGRGGDKFKGAIGMRQKESRTGYHLTLVCLALLLAGGVVWYKYPYSADRFLPPEEKVQTIFYGTLIGGGEFKTRDNYIRDREGISEFYERFRDVRAMRLLGERNVINTTKAMTMILTYTDHGRERMVTLEISNGGDFSRNGGKRAYRLWSRPKDSLFASLKAFFSDEE